MPEDLELERAIWQAGESRAAKRYRHAMMIAWVGALAMATYHLPAERTIHAVIGLLPICVAVYYRRTLRNE